MTQCAVYIRKSREDRDKPSHRLTVQRERLPAHARAQGWSVESYEDGHASAARGKAEELKERSRLSRDETLEDYLPWLYLCSSHGVKLATLSRVLDPSQHSDWMRLLIKKAPCLRGPFFHSPKTGKACCYLPAGGPPFP